MQGAPRVKKTSLPLSREANYKQTRIKKASVETPASKTSVYDNHFILNAGTLLFILEKPRLRKNASGATTKKTKQCLKS